MKWWSKLVNQTDADLYALDEEGNEELLDGSEDKSISEHCGREQSKDNVCLFCAVVCGLIGGVLGILIPILRNHCMHTYYKHNPGKKPKS